MLSGVGRPKRLLVVTWGLYEMLLRLREKDCASSEESEDMLSVRFVSEERRKSPVDGTTGDAMVKEDRLFVVDAEAGGDDAKVRVRKPGRMLGEGEGKSGLYAATKFSGLSDSGRRLRPAGRGRVGVASVVGVAVDTGESSSGTACS